MIVALLAACQTPAPQTQPESLNDDVVVPTTEPLSETKPVPEPEPQLEPPPQTEPEQHAEPEKPAVESHIPKPQLPDEMSFQETALARTAQQQRKGLIWTPVLEGGEGECGIPAAIRASADDGAGYTIGSCRRAVDAAHALTYERHVSKLGVLDISDVAIRHDGKPIWTVFDDCVGLRQSDSACSTDYIAHEMKVWSFVGPLLSYEVLRSEAAAGGHGYADTQGFTIDVRTGRPSKFDALIDASSLVNALKRDSYLRRHLDPNKLDAAKTLEEIWALWGTTTFGHFGAYYFQEWDAQTGQVAMRILFREDTEVGSPNNLKELGVWVLPKRKWREVFEDAASRESGFFAKR